MHFKETAVFALLLTLLPGLGAAQQSTTKLQDGVTVKDTVTAQVSPFTDQLRKTIVFLQVDFIKDQRHWSINGTGFLVSYTDDRLPKDKAFVYLVTNRHMAEPGAEDGQRYPVEHYHARLNFKERAEGPESLEAREVFADPVPGGSWVFPNDPSVDLAAIPVDAEHILADYKTVPISSIITNDEIKALQIAPGDQVLFAGFFYQFPGVKRIEPIVREGILAMIPDEPIRTTLHRPGMVYLADIHAFHGNSGSPVFVNVGGIRAGALSPARYLLLGVVSGYYPESETDFSIPAARVLTGEVHDNSGVTAIVPGKQVKALLDSPELEQARERVIAALAKK